MEPLAVYGAIVATISIGWQIASRVMEKQTRLRVEVYALPPGGPPGWIEVLCINNSEHAVRTIGLAFALPDGSNEMFVGSDPVAFQIEDFTTVIAPRDATNGVLLFSEFEQLDMNMSAPMVAVVTTADQKRFRSKPFVPNSLWNKT